MKEKEEEIEKVTNQCLKISNGFFTNLNSAIEFEKKAS